MDRPRPASHETGMQKIKQWYEHGGIGWLLLSISYQHTKFHKTLDIRAHLYPALMLGVKTTWWAKKHVEIRLYLGPLEVQWIWHDFNHARHYI